jgi:formate--tetrahydrofolate ligase
VVAINRFITDSDEEVEAVRAGCKAIGAKVALCEVWEKGGDGGIELGEAVLELLEEGKADFKPIYDTALPIRQKIEIVAKEIYRADGVTFMPVAIRAAARLEKWGLGDTPLCMAKTQYSFSDNASLLGAPSGFKITVRDIYPSAGAGFVIALCGDIMTMPGLGKTPAAERMRVSADGTIEGLF